MGFNSGFKGVNLPCNKFRFCNFITEEAVKYTIIKKRLLSEHNLVRWASCRCCSHVYSIGHYSDSCVLNPRHSTRVVRITASLSCQVEQLGPFWIHMIGRKHSLHDMGLEFLTALHIKVAIFWDVTSHTLKLEEACSSDTRVPVYQTKRHNAPADSSLDIPSRKN